MNRLACLLILCISILLLLGCDSSKKINEKKFFDLYEEILTIRVIESDTTIANPKVRELFEKHNYSQEQFKTDFMKLSEMNEDQRFAKKIDSLRQYVLVNKISNKKNDLK